MRPIDHSEFGDGEKKMAFGYGVERREPCTCKLSMSGSWNENVCRPGVGLSVCFCVCVCLCVCVCVWMVGDAPTNCCCTHVLLVMVSK